MARSREAIESLFPTASGSHVVPTPETREQSRQYRDLVTDIALIIDESQDDSRWKSLALVHLEEALMWANKGLFNKEIR